MGVTNFSTSILDQFIERAPVKSVIELGAQNLYHPDYPNAPHAHLYYEARGFTYKCIDLNGENNALKLDLSQPLNLGETFGLVTDFGTSEHVGDNGKFSAKAFYTCWLNKHNLCAEGGLIISENPKSGNWPGHGFNYHTQEFYRGLAEANGYEVLSLGESAAMGNITDGWNVYCVLRKVNSNPFMKLSEFKELEFKTA